MPGKVVVIGVGNPLLGDEGLGIASVERLREEHLPKDVELVEAGTGSLDALVDAKDAERVVIVDAIDAGREPGTLYRLDARDLLDSDRSPCLSLHELGLRESLCLAELEGFRRERLVVVGMQPATVRPSMVLSPIVERRMDALLSAVRQEIRRAGNGTYEQEAG
jgi:hydrogenase maturation protease